ncbi:MAG: glycosyltransferase family 39 protein [Opitutaceae bacterium]|nr:glycosyltransferase family 39 protein [Opitutaceae bacterium]
MKKPRTIQEWIHWLEMGAGARWVRRAAVLVGGLVLSLLVAWKQFHGPGSEAVLVQADVGRQLARGAGFTTQVIYPQSVAVLEARGTAFDPKRPLPELHQAPLYSLCLGAALWVLPEGAREALFAKAPAPPDGFAADYFLLGFNLVLLWLAAWLTFDLGRRLFEPRVGWVAALGVMLSVPLWRHTVAVNGLPLLMVLVLVAFRLWWAWEQALADGRRSALAWAAGLGAVGGLLFLTEYSAGALVLVVAAYAFRRFAPPRRWLGVAVVAGAFVVVTGPWVFRNVALTGSPVGLAVQNVALKAGDSTAEPDRVLATLSADLLRVDLNKLGNKTLTSLQETVTSRLWAGGALWFTAFFVTGWLYSFRHPGVDRLRWVFTVTLGVLVLSQAVCNSGASERLPVYYLSPLIILFGAAFFFLLVGSSTHLGAWPRVAATVLLCLQAVPLVRDALEPRRLHFSYPPYFPGLFQGLRQELERRGAAERFVVMADVPAGAAWYGDQRVWAQPDRLRDLFAVTLEQDVGLLLLTPRSLERPFFADLALAQANAISSRTYGTERFGDWSRIYAGLAKGAIPVDFPLQSPQRISDNLYVLMNPALPRPLEK